MFREKEESSRHAALTCLCVFLFIVFFMFFAVFTVSQTDDFFSTQPPCQLTGGQPLRLISSLTTIPARCLLYSKTENCTRLVNVGNTFAAAGNGKIPATFIVYDNNTIDFFSQRQCAQEIDVRGNGWLGPLFTDFVSLFPKNKADRGSKPKFYFDSGVGNIWTGDSGNLIQFESQLDQAFELHYKREAWCRVIQSRRVYDMACDGQLTHSEDYITQLADVFHGTNWLLVETQSQMDEVFSHGLTKNVASFVSKTSKTSKTRIKKPFLPAENFTVLASLDSSDQASDVVDQMFMFNFDPEKKLDILCQGVQLAHWAQTPLAFWRFDPLSKYGQRPVWILDGGNVQNATVEFGTSPTAQVSSNVELFSNYVRGKTSYSLQNILFYINDVPKRCYVSVQETILKMLDCENHIEDANAFYLQDNSSLLLAQRFSFKEQIFHYSVGDFEQYLLLFGSSKPKKHCVFVNSTAQLDNFYFLVSEYDPITVIIAPPSVVYRNIFTVTQRKNVSIALSPVREKNFFDLDELINVLTEEVLLLTTFFSHTFEQLRYDVGTRKNLSRKFIDENYRRVFGFDHFTIGNVFEANFFACGNIFSPDCFLVHQV